MEKELTLEDGLVVSEDLNSLLSQLKERKISYRLSRDLLKFEYSLFGVPFTFRAYREKDALFFFSAEHVFLDTEEDAFKEDLEKKVKDFFVSLFGEPDKEDEFSSSWNEAKVYLEHHNTPESREGAFKKPYVFFRCSFKPVTNLEHKVSPISIIVLIVLILIIVITIIVLAVTK